MSSYVDKQFRTFLLLTISCSLTAWDIGFDAGAFENFSYRRIFTVFVVATVLFIASFMPSADTLLRAWSSRLCLVIPMLYMLADLLLITDFGTVQLVLIGITVASFPYALYILAKSLAGDYFELNNKQRLGVTLIVLFIGLAGFYVGSGNNRFLNCSDFERSGDFVPAACYRQVQPTQ